MHLKVLKVILIMFNLCLFFTDDFDDSNLDSLGDGLENSADVDNNNTGEGLTNTSTSSVDLNINNSNNEGAEGNDDENEHDERVDDFWTEAYGFLNNFQNLREALRYLAIAGHLSRSFLNLLLAILRKFGHPELPNDARTLLKIPKVGNEIQNVVGGHFWYPGIKVAIRNFFKRTIPETSDFNLQISTDRLPLFKSSSTQFWPLLFKVEEIPNCPVMVAGIFSGEKKPGNLEQFLRPLVEELNTLHLTGMQFGERTIRVRVKCLIADAPARAFKKSVLGFSGKHGCTKCTILGEHVQPEGKVIFEGVFVQILVFVLEMISHIINLSDRHWKTSWDWILLKRFQLPNDFTFLTAVVAVKF
ncbi:uncharacterized protein LOC118516444 [Anopheles stephensi]|uniref:uncharacterized protein LOC118516444 n=1 Tax=Anopheles stephensi TaxID=30069 RepID=UPI001658AA6B|nr:uncharacterized protein LOC118516444 [Anopheles stephensi]XP_035918228.1 uncharacterized protein LOC118516444 [Anopheles stephensi]